jgi:hypothetical protein
MPMWRCPHCGTPQAETARCWVCRRSSTSCATCRNYRRSVAGKLGYCGLDRRRQPLTGEEIRGCWEGWAATSLPEQVVPLTITPARPPDEDRRPLAFVEVTAAQANGDDPATVAVGTAPTATEPATANEPAWSLWGEPEP